MAYQMVFEYMKHFTIQLGFTVIVVMRSPNNYNEVLKI